MPKFLTKEQVEFYKENGYIKLDNIFSKEEFDEISDEYDHLFKTRQNNNMETSWRGNYMNELSSNKSVSVLALHNFQYHSAVYTKLLLNDRLLDALEDIMGTQNILLHHNKAHLKPPETGAPYPMHQDYHYFPFKKHSMVAAFIHMDDTSPENGGLAVYPGSHKLGPLEDKGVTDRGESFHYVDQEKWPLSGATPIHAKRGDIVVFSYLLLHGSYLNTSDRVRRMFLIQHVSNIGMANFLQVYMLTGYAYVGNKKVVSREQLMAAEDEPTEAKHVSYGQGMVLRGRNPKRGATMADRFSQ